MRGFPLARSFALSSFLGAALVGCATMEAGYPGEAEAGYEADDSTFYRSLAPHGHWVNSIEFGWVWYPRHRAVGWRPYTVGRWAWSDQGWMWDSYEPWGWATYHYGSWYMDPYYGWVWVPGRVWGPAWVSWRECDNYIGWYPIDPWGYRRYDRDHGRRHGHDGHHGDHDDHHDDDHDGHHGDRDGDHDRDGDGRGGGGRDGDGRGGGGRDGDGHAGGDHDRDGGGRDGDGRDDDRHGGKGRDKSDGWNFTPKKDFTSSRVDKVIIDRHTLPQVFESSRDLDPSDGTGISRGVDKRTIERATGRPIEAVKIEDRNSPPEGNSEKAGRTRDRVPVYRPQIKDKPDVATPDRLGLAPAPAVGGSGRPPHAADDPSTKPGRSIREPGSPETGVSADPTRRTPEKVAPSGTTRGYPRIPSAPHTPKTPHTPKSPSMPEEPRGGGSSVQPRGGSGREGSGKTQERANSGTGKSGVYQPRGQGSSAGPPPGGPRPYTPPSRSRGETRTYTPPSPSRGESPTYSPSSPSRGKTPTYSSPPPSRGDTPTYSRPSPSTGGGGRPYGGADHGSGGNSSGSSRSSGRSDSGRGSAPSGSSGSGSRSGNGGSMPSGAGVSSPYGGGSHGSSSGMQGSAPSGGPR